MFKSLFLASALALGLAGFAHAADLAFYAAKSTLLGTGSTTTDATTALVSGPAIVVTSGSKVADFNAQIVLQVISPVADGGSFDLTCTSGTTGSIGSATKVTVTSKTTSPVAASNQYTLASASSTAPVTVSFPSLTAGSACASGLVCGAGTTAVTITCSLSATSGTTLPSTLTAGTYAFTVNVVDPIPAGVDATVTCTVAADVTGAYLSLAKTTSTDVATATVTATPLVLSIVPGTSAMRGDTGANFLTNQKLTTNDSVQAIEGNAYGAGGLFKVVLDQNAPEGLTVTCLVDSTMSAVLANSTTSTDYTVSIASGSGTSASSITLPAVQSISTASNILLTCTATNAAGRVYSTASTYVAATPLKLVITAANGAIQSINTDGTYTNFKANTDLTSSNNQVVRIEAQADTAGGTVTIKANSAPTAAVTITCTPSDTTVIPSVTVASTISTATAVNVTIGTVAAISAQKSVTVTCAPSSAAGGLSTTDSVTFTVIADPVRFIVKAQTTAIQSIETTNELAYFTAETALVSVVNGPSNGTVYRLEGQADSSGNTLKVYMNAVPSGGSYTLTCSTTGATYSATPALASAVASANSLSGTGVGVDLKTFSDVATATSSVVTCVVSSGADNFVTVSDGFAVNVIAQPPGFIVTAQSGATKSVASTNVLTPFGSATTLTAVKGGSSNDTVFLLEGQTDADSTAGALLLTAGAVNSSFTTTLTVSRVGTGSSAAGTKQSVVAASTTAFQQDQVALSGTYVATDTVAVEVDTTNVKTTVTYTANSTDGVTLANVAAGVKAAVASPLGGATIATDNVLLLTATAVNAVIDTYTVTVAQVGTGSSAVGGLASAIMAKSTNVKQVDAIALSGTFVATDTITVADSTTGAAVSWKYTVNSTDGTTLAQVIAGLKTALGPQLGGAAISSSTNVVTITAATAGTALPTYTVTATGGTATTATQATTTANAAGTKQVDTVTIGGTPATGNTVTVTIGNVVVTLTLDSTSVASTTTVASALAAALSKVLNGTAALSTTNAFTITAGTANTAQTTTPTVVSTAAGTVAGANAIAKNTNVKAVDVVYLGGTWAANVTVKVVYALTGSNVSTALTFTVSAANATALGNPLGGVTAALVGGTVLQVQLNGNSGGANQMSCTTTTASDFSNSVVPTVLPVTTTTNVAVNMNTIADLSTAKTITLTCTVAAAGNHLQTSDGFSLNIVLQPLGFIVTAQTGAIKSVASTNALTTFGTATAITAAISGTSNTTVYLLEGQADTAGNTIKVSLNGASGGANALTCTTTTASNFASSTVPTVANVTDTTQVAMDMMTVADLSSPISITLTCKVNTAGNHLTTSDGFQLNLTLQPLGFIVTAQSAAYKSVDSTGNLTAYGANTAIVSTIGSSSLGQVVVVEGQADAGGTVLTVALNGSSGGANALTCTESGTSDFSATPTAAAVTDTTAVNVTLNTPNSITTSKTITLTCKVTTAANHLTTSDGFSVSIVIQPMQILIVAGSNTSLTSGSSLSSGTIVPSTVKVVDKEYMTPTAGYLLAVKLNGANAGASISVACTSGNTINLPNSATSTDYTKSFGTSGSTTARNLTLGTAYPSVADGDIVLLKVSGNTTSVWAMNNPTMSTAFGKVSQVGGDSVTLKFQNGSADTPLTGGSVVSCTAYSDSAFSTKASSAFTVGGTTSETFTFATTANTGTSTANNIAAQGTSATTTAITIQNVTQTKFYVKCTANDSTNGWSSIKTAFILDVTPQMQAVAGSAAYRSTMPTAQITAGTVLSTSTCLTPRIFEGEDTAAGAIATLSFGNSATATVNCVSGTTAALASPSAVTVSGATTASIDFGAPTATTSAVTVTVTCTVASSPAPTGVTAGQAVSFQVTIMPRSVSAVVSASTLTRQSDGTTIASGTSIGYSTAGSTSMTPVLYEGSASTGQIGLQLNYTPTGSQGATGTVSFSCSSSNTIAPAVAAFSVSSTSVTFTIPAVTGISADTTVTYTCSPTSGGGFVFTGTAPSNYTVKFDVYVMRAKLTPVPAATTVLNGNATAFGSTSTDLTSSTYNAALAVQVFEGAGSDTSKVLLQQNTAPGATGTVKCSSSNSNIMPDIVSVSITNDTTADAITLPAPTNMGSTNVQVSYTCAPTAAFGNLATTDSATFWVNVVAVNVQAAAASSQTLGDGTTLAADTALPSGKSFVMYEGQSTGLGTTVELLANTTPATSGTSASVTYACTSNNSSVIGTISDVTLSSTKAAITLPTPGSINADTDVIITCTPKASAGGLTTSESVAFTVHVKAIVVAAYSGTAQTATDGKTAMTTSTMLVSGKASATPQIIELAAASSISNVVALQANSTPTATITYSCTSSNTSVLGSVSSVQVNSTTAVSVGLPQSGQIDKATTVTYTCAPTAAAGGVTTSDTFTFDVTVVPLAVSAQAGTAATTAAGATLAQGTALASGNAAKTPTIVTTVTPAAGALVQLVANGTPSAAVTYKCTSSDSKTLADVTASVSTTTAVGLTFGAAGDVSTATTVTFTCAPTANAGGLTTADSFTFDVTVVPRMVDVYPSAALTAADGNTPLSTSTKISGGGSLAKTVQLYAGVTYAAGSTVALKVNVAPTAAVSYVCTSSNKTVIGDVAATSVSTTTAVNLVLPTPAVVSAGTLVTFTCAPSAAAGGFATTVSVTFDVFVSNPTAQVVAGSAAGTAADGTTTLTAGGSILGSGIASRTPVVYEGAAASSTIVALQATAAPQTATTYSCKSSNSTVLADINVSLSTATAVAITIPVASSVSADTTVTYTCTPGSVAAPTPAPTPAATTSSTPAATTAPTPAATQASTPASTATPAPTTPAAAKTTVTGTVFFDVKVKALKPAIKAGSSAIRADNLALASGTDISGGGSLAITPALMYGQSTTSGAIATISLNATATVTFGCTSSASTVLASITGLSVSGTSTVNIQIPTPMGTLTGDTTVTYTCAPTTAAGGLDTTDSVKFDVYVYYYGLMAVAGSSAINNTTLLSITADTNVGYSTTASLAPLLIMYAGRNDVVKLMTKTPAMDSSNKEVAVDVYCASNNTSVMTDVTVSGLLNAGTALSLPNPAAVTKNTTVTYTCTVVCASSPYKGTESVKFDVVVLARALVAVAGSSATTASGTSVASGTLLTSGSASLTPAVFELQSSTSGALVKLYTTVPPSAAVSVTCTSSDTATLPNVTSTLSMSTTSNLVGGSAVSVAIPTSLTISADKTVTYTCTPSSSAGGYTTEAAKFDVYMRNQTVVFVTGTKAIVTDSKGKALTAGSQVTSIQAIEQTQYAAGELINLEALNQAVTVDCTLTNAKNSPTYTGSVLASSTATTPDIAVGTSSTAVYLSAMPSVTGSATTLVLSCSPKTAGSGYQTSDVFSMNIVINDLFPTPTPIASGTPQAKFTVTLSFKTQPSSVQLAAIEAQIQSTVATKLGVPTSSVVVTASTSRRALLDVAVNLNVAVAAATNTAAQALVTAVGDGSALATSIQSALIAAAADPTSALYNLQVPSVVASVATVPTPAPTSGPGSSTPSSTPAPTKKSGAAATLVSSGLVVLGAVALLL